MNPVLPDADARFRGVVKWFAKHKGYGFIEWQEGGRELYCHFTEVARSGQRNLERGEIVEFSVRETERGWQAVHVIPQEPPRSEGWGD